MRELRESVRVRMVTAVRYRTEMAETRRLTPEDWASAALEVMAADGLDGVSIEGLARKLGVTKGSFYWHFADRAALVTAALDLWERLGTNEVIEHLRAVADPEQRLRKLFELSFGDEVEGPVDAALVARIEDPVVGPVVRRVTEVRVGFLEEVYRDLGLSRSRAAVQARITYCTYVGHFLVRRAMPDDTVLAGPSQLYFRQLLGTVVQA